MKQEISRALRTLVLACAVACADADEADMPLDEDASSALADDEPPDAMELADAARSDLDAVAPEAAADAVTEPALDPALDAAAAPAALDASAVGGSARDASMEMDAGAADASEQADAELPSDARVDASDAGQATHDAASEAGAGGLDAAQPAHDAGGSDASEAGPADADTPGDGSTPDAAPPERATFTRIYALLRQRCRSCHLPGATYSLDFSTKQIAYDELVGGPNMGAAEFIVCSGFGYRRVIPGDPDGSLLVQKLEATQPCGDRMPPGAMPDLALSGEVRRWIEAGALND